MLLRWWQKSNFSTSLGTNPSGWWERSEELDRWSPLPLVVIFLLLLLLLCTSISGFTFFQRNIVLLKISYKMYLKLNSFINSVIIVFFKYKFCLILFYFWFCFRHFSTYTHLFQVVAKAAFFYLVFIVCLFQLPRMIFNNFSFNSGLTKYTNDTITANQKILNVWHAVFWTNEMSQGAGLISTT